MAHSWMTTPPMAPVAPLRITAKDRIEIYFKSPRRRTRDWAIRLTGVAGLEIAVVLEEPVRHAQLAVHRRVLQGHQVGRDLDQVLLADDGERGPSAEFGSRFVRYDPVALDELLGPRARLEHGGDHGRPRDERAVAHGLRGGCEK